METYYAPAARTERRLFKNQIETISQSPIISTLLKTMSGLMVILNEDRQIVGLNHLFLEMLGIDNPEEALGLRLGESLHCIHADKLPSGCGTTSHCRTCGAVIAIMGALEGNCPEEQICALTAEKDGERRDFCLLVRAQPVEIDGFRWVLVFAQDITQQQFWVNLEQVFFHDINNVLTVLLAHAQRLSARQPGDRDVEAVEEVSRRLAGEIALQRCLSAQRDASYLLQKSVINLDQLREELDLVVRSHVSLDGRQLIEDWPQQEVCLSTDILLLSRVLGNMLINALEATAKGGKVRLSVSAEADSVIWEVWNAGAMPVAVKQRIFQRHFSTKAKSGRGLGTYSMKIFGEKYLGGRVDFESTPEFGTCFRFRLPRS